MQAVITVIGKDKVGILAKAATKCADLNANIVDVEQSIMQDLFTRVMIVNIDNLSVEFEYFKKEVKDALTGMEVYVMHEDIFNAMHKI